MIGKRLFIPRKTQNPVNADDYGIDMRTIENFNPINQITAGTGITLMPTSGTGPDVTISASSSGGLTYSQVNIELFPDAALSLPPMWLTGNDPSTLGNVGFPLFSTGASGGPFSYSFGSSWIVSPVGGQSVAILPIIQGINYSSGSVSGIIQMQAFSLDLSNIAFTSFSTVPIPTATSFQWTDTDFAPLTNYAGADISLVAGSGNTGNGLVSAAGGKIYFASITGVINVALNTTLFS